jgi:radical SAM protein with 4Fe4S-binding SPASM domain
MLTESLVREISDYLSAPQFITRVQDTENFVLVPQTGRWFKTTPMGTWFMNQCDGIKTFDDIAEIFAHQNNIKPEQASLLLEPFVASLLREGFIQQNASYLYPQVIQPQDIPLEGLRSIWLHGSHRCNLYCFFCYSNSGLEKAPELTAADIENLMSQIPDPSLVWFQISGGEPFLWSHLAEAVKIIKQSGSSIVVITNGTVGTVDDYTAVIPWVDRFQFSIDGVSSETNDRHRGKGSFEKAMQHIRLAKTLGMKEIILSFTPSRHNIHDLPAMFKLTQDLDAVSLHVNRLMPIGRGVRSQPVLAASDEDYSAALDELMEIYQGYVRQKRAEHYANSLKVGYDAEEAFSHIINLDISGDQSRKVITYACRTNCGTSNMLSIDPDGSVYSCPSLHLPELRLGNLREDTLETMWQARRPFVEQTCVDSLPDCKDCTHRYICGGGCRALAYSSTGDLCGKDPLCEKMKTAIENCIWLMKI